MTLNPKKRSFAKPLFSTMVSLAFLLGYLSITQVRAATIADITDDQKVDLEDAIVALQVLAGLAAPVTVSLSGDVNGDNRIGIEEAIYALREVAGLYNRPPELNPIGDKSVDESSMLTFQISAADPDADSLTYSASNLPDGASFDPGTRIFSWTPTYSQSGTYGVTFTVTDTYGSSDSETITITVDDKTPVFVAPEYFPLMVGNWWDFKDDHTGAVERSSVSGTRSISGTTAYIYLYSEGAKEYYSSDSNGIWLYGLYLITNEYTGDVIFDKPLLLMPNNAQIGTTQVSTSSFSMTVYYPGYGYVTIHADITATMKILGLEDVQTSNKTLRDCFKGSMQMSMYIREAGQTITGETTYYWFAKGVGPVKEFSSSYSGTVSAANVNGIRYGF